MRPRNTLVTVAEIKSSETKTGSGIVLPANTSNEYKLAEVIHVGDGGLTHKDEISPCADLKPGQLVLVKLAAQRRMSRDYVSIEPIGIGFKTADGRDLSLVDQTQIFAILADSVPAETTTSSILVS